MAALAFLALLALGACAPWWPTRYSPYAGTRGEAVVCVEQVLRDQRLRSGEKWELFGHDTEAFTRWRYRYLDRQISAAFYLGTFDEITVDVLSDGMFRINARGWHWYGAPHRGFHEEQKAPGPAAHRAAAQVEARCS